MADAINLIIDTDAGIDDLLGIAFLATQSNVNIQAITVVNGLSHVPAGAANVLQLLAVMGKPDIPVYMGAEEPWLGGTNFEEDWRETADELPGIFDTMRIVTTPPKTGATDFLAGQFASTTPVTLLALGPHTNLADALEKSAGVVTGISQVVMMGGAIHAPGNVTLHGDTDAEWNIFEDPGAAAKVFASALPIFLVPLDACDDVPIDAAFIQAAAQGMTSETAFLIFKLLILGFGSNGGDYFAWDPLAAVTVVNPSVITATEQTDIEVVTRLPFVGELKAITGTKVTAATAADPSAFQSTFVGAFS